MADHMFTPHQLLRVWIVVTSFLATRETFKAYTGSLSAPNPTDSRYARMYATWTFLSSIIRVYAAWKIENFDLYIVAMWTYGVAAVYFSLEVFVYRIQNPRSKWAIPVAVITLVWMATQASSHASIVDQ